MMKSVTGHVETAPCRAKRLDMESPEQILAETLGTEPRTIGRYVLAPGRVNH